ncbi:lipoate-protein ligase A [Rhodobacter sp. JA431]|uniref:lipoate--protein ligase family protein n=1 Tax=Rhodobacter sp. JA431 TaxID=570013 RepID=UPI000BCE6B20|nr:biotin/lipoate A/B protein ligase family protein [Rhodobacter sp. JA431]SOC03770.1 lipoate-protein ligase A [Rhodobacter sp. JA431]
MTKPFRVIDTGVRPGRAQIAFDQALIEAHKAGTIPDTIRFLTFPPTVLVGRHQAIGQELNLPACRAAGVGIGRRVTGGGALYLDEGQFGWELVFHKQTLGLPSLGDVARELCEAAAEGLQSLGIAARYRPRNDIEVEGRKISGTGGFFDGDTIFYQGTILRDMDGAKMAGLLNIPAAKLARHGAQAGAQRIVTMTELFNGAPPPEAEVKEALVAAFAKRLGIAPSWGAITSEEEALAQKFHDEEIGTDDFVYGIDDPTRVADVLSGTHAGAGGTITAHLRLEGPAQDRIREVLFTGDFFVAPPRIVPDLEAALRGVELAAVESTVAQYFENAQAALMSAPGSDFARAVRVAAAMRHEPAG